MTRPADDAPTLDEVWALRLRQPELFARLSADLQPGPVATLMRARAEAGQGRLDECLRLCAEAEEALGEPTVWRARLLEVRATTLNSLGLADQARPLLEQAWKIYDCLDDTLGRASVRQNIATLSFQSYDTAHDLYQEALDLALLARQDDLVGVILLNLESVAEARGASLDARAELVRRARAHLEGSWPQMAVHARCVELCIRLDQEDLDGARVLRQGLPPLEQIHDPGTRCYLGRTLAQLAWAEGDLHAAVAALDAVLEGYLLAEDEVLLQEERLDLLEALGRHGEALAAARRALELRRQVHESSTAAAARALDVWHRTSMLRQEREREKDRADQLERALAELRDASRRIHELSIRDTVTGLHNRQFLMDNSPLLLATATREAPAQLALIDIDRFKRVNDTYGHATGDLVLRQFADRLRAHLRDSDLVVRHGGEEFVVVRAAGPRAGSLAGDLEALRAVLACATWTGEGGVDLPAVTMSAGVTLVPNAANPGDTTLDSALARADALMYRAKHSGRDAVRHDAQDVDAPPHPPRPGPHPTTSPWTPTGLHLARSDAPP